jgi:hypothetical protein
VEQPVTQFTDQRVPVSLGLLLDASDSMRGKPIADAREAVEHFVGDLLWADDEAFIALFNHRPRLAAPWTQPASSLRTASPVSTPAAARPSTTPSSRRAVLRPRPPGRVPRSS